MPDENHPADAPEPESAATRPEPPREPEAPSGGAAESAALPLDEPQGLVAKLRGKRYLRGLLASEEEANKQLRLLLDAGREMGSTLDMDTILDRIIHYTAAVTDADLAAVYLWDRGSRALHAAQVHGANEQKMMFKQFPLETGLVGRAASSRSIVAVDDMARHDERDNVFFGAASPRSQLIVPLGAREKFIGLLVTANNAMHPYTEEEKRLLQGFAELASLAIANAELYRIARLSLDAAAKQRGMAASILDQMVAGVITCDSKGRVVVFNPEAQRLTGYAFSEMTQALLRPERSLDDSPLGPLEHHMLEVLEKPTVMEGEALIMKTDKMLVPVNYRIYPLSDGARVIGAAAVFMEKSETEHEKGRTDIDHQVLLRSLGARVERLYTHPLSRVLDRVKHMDIDQWSHSRDDITSILEAGSAALLSLLEDVEQYLNCVTVREWDAKDEHDLRALTGEVVRDILESGDHEGVVVMVKLDGLPSAYGYGRMISAALEEVVENAVIAASAQGKKVEVTGRPADGFVHVEVRDSGPGISADEREFMYLPFFTGREGTSGLGLSIAKRVMRRLGGHIGVEDSQGGAVFFLEFPVAPRAGDDRAEPDAAEDVGGPARAVESGEG